MLTKEDIPPSLARFLIKNLPYRTLRQGDFQLFSLDKNGLEITKLLQRVI